MEKVWFLVICLLLINKIFAFDRDCSNLRNLKNCDECIRCGGIWCSDPKENTRCTEDVKDNWCSANQESPKHYGLDTESGTLFDYKFQFRTLMYDQSGKLPVTYSSKFANKTVTIIPSSTQSIVRIRNETTCVDDHCTITIDPLLETSFCLANGRVDEYFSVKVSVEGVTEETELKYHVPCACECSSNVERESSKCSGNGNYSCGACTCNKGWTGDSCDICNSAVEHQSPMCHGRGSYSCGQCSCDKGWGGKFCDKCKSLPSRGDIGCAEFNGDDDCSGNGRCGMCDVCECYDDKEGSRYFDRNNFCKDLCMSLESCKECFFDPRPGRCQHCDLNVYRQTLNQSVISEKDEKNRNIWVKCNATKDECTKEYMAMRNDVNDIFYMVINSCDATTDRIVSAYNVTVPVVLGILALVAAVAATLGYMYWKNHTPPLPLNDPMYQNIDAEDCTGENPLYKPPTSSFKNPTYGKW